MTAPEVTPALDAWAVAQRQFDIAADRLDLDPALRAVLREAERELIVSVPVRMDDGSVQVFSGYRVQHNLGRGPSKGGLRYHQDVTLNEVRALAMWMTWKCAVVAFPTAAARAAWPCDPKGLSLRELEGLTRRFTTNISVIIGPQSDIPAPDVDTNPQVMAWIVDTYSMHVGYTVPGVVTGKPVALGGSEGRAEATGRGVVVTISEAASHIGLDIIGATVAVQGFGNVGLSGRHPARRDGCVGRGRVRLAGRHPRRLTGWTSPRSRPAKAEHGTVVGFPGAKDISNAELLEVDCDVLIPAALENQITRDNAERVRARIVAEAANGPTTPDADGILARKGVFMIPRHPVQRRRRDRLLFRVGAGPQPRPVVRRGRQQQAHRHHGPLLRRGRGHGRARGLRHAHRGLPAGRGPRGHGHRPARPLPLASGGHSDPTAMRSTCMALDGGVLARRFPSTISCRRVPVSRRFLGKPTQPPLSPSLTVDWGYGMP